MLTRFKVTNLQTNEYSNYWGVAAISEKHIDMFQYLLKTGGVTYTDEKYNYEILGIDHERTIDMV